VVGLAVLLGAVAIIRAVGIHQAAVGHIGIGSVAAGVIDARIQVTGIVVVALAVLIAAGLNLGIDAGPGGVVAHHAAYIGGARIAVPAIVAALAAGIHGSMLAHVGLATVHSAQVGIRQTGMVPGVITVAGIGGVLAQVVQTVVDGGRIAVVPLAARTAVRVHRAAVIHGLVLFVAAGIDRQVAGIDGAGIAVAAVGIVVATLRVDHGPVTTLMGDAHIQGADIPVVTLVRRLLFAAGRVPVVREHALVGGDIADVDGAEEIVVAVIVL